MISSGAIGLSFVMVSNTWTRISLEEKVVGSSTLVLAFTPCASTCVCRCWSWARFKGVNDEFFTTPVGEEFSEPYDYITGFYCHQLHLEVGITGTMPSRKTRLRSSLACAFAQQPSSWARRAHRVPVPVAGPAHRHDAQSQTPVLETGSRRAQKGVPVRSVNHAREHQSRSDGCSSRSFLFRNTTRACSFAAQLIDVSSFSS